MSSWLNLTRKTAIITGAASGIGRSIARAFYDQGCNVILADNDSAALETTMEDVWPTSKNSNYEQQNIKYNVCDVRDNSQMRDLMTFADEFHDDCNGIGGGASILVNAAGITRDGLMNDIVEANYDDVLDVNLKGTFLSCQSFCKPARIQALCSSGGASIINIGSVISERGNIGQTNYAASKGGVAGLTRALAKELAFTSSKYSENGSSEKRGMIRVNAILPGFIRTPMTEGLPETIRERILRQIPLQRFGSPEDVANMAMFLASQDRSGYVTGECWECSGAISL